MENSPKSGFPWNFTTVLTKDGYRYVKAYRMKWDPVLKKSKRCLQRHVGRLFEDGRIKISPKFSADFPEYAPDLRVIYDLFHIMDHKLLHRTSRKLPALLLRTKRPANSRRPWMSA